MTMAEKLALLPVLIPVLVGSLVLHELAHAWVATWFGDPTPREQGRLTFNPITHLDPLGAGMFVVTFLVAPFAFGWAKPVMVDTRKLKHPKRDMGIVAVAGPMTNFVIAFVVLAIVIHVWAPEGKYLGEIVNQLVIVNIVLGVFNLLPVPPLDGSRIVAMFMSDNLHRDWQKLDQYAPITFILLFLVFRDKLGALIGSGYEHVLKAMLRVLT